MVDAIVTMSVGNVGGTGVVKHIHVVIPKFTSSLLNADGFSPNTTSARKIEEI